MRRKSPLVLAFLAAVLVALVGSSVAYAALQKTVTISVDGHAQTVHTFGRTVGAVLDRAGIAVGAHDEVVPDRGAPVRDGSRVVVVHGRLIALTLDGQHRDVWVDALSVSDALTQLGLRQDGEYVSTSRSLSIPRQGLSLTVRLPQRVWVLVDGHRLHPTTTLATLAQLLAAIHVTLGPNDHISAPLSTYPYDGLVVRVVRVRQSHEVQMEAIPFRTITRSDPSLYRGQERVVQAGAPGARELDYVDTLHDGRLVRRTLVQQKVVAAPQTRIIDVGTKPVPQYTPSADGLNWRALAECESGDNPRAVSPGGTYRGLYQFSMSTWHGVGGSGDPINASAGEQTYRAQILYRRDGTSPWPVCGHYLYS